MRQRRPTVRLGGAFCSFSRLSCSRARLSRLVLFVCLVRVFCAVCSSSWFLAAVWSVRHPSLGCCRVRFVLFLVAGRASCCCFLVFFVLRSVRPVRFLSPVRVLCRVCLSCIVLSQTGHPHPVVIPTGIPVQKGTSLLPEAELYTSPHTMLGRCSFNHPARNQK